MKYAIYHKPSKHCLLAICSSMESAQRWVENFNPKMWMDKTMKQEELEIRPYKF